MDPKEGFAVCSSMWGFLKVKVRIEVKRVTSFDPVAECLSMQRIDLSR